MSAGGSALLNVLLSGQSNALGQRAGGPPFSDCHAAVEVWNNFNPLGSYGYEWVRPREARPPFQLSRATNNLGVWFAHHAAQRLGSPVRLTVVATANRSIIDWLPGVGPMFDTIEAIFHAQGAASYDVMLWHQGEADRGCDSAWYREALEWLVNELRDQRILTRKAPAILGGLPSPMDACINHVLRETAQENASMRFVDAAGVPTEGSLEHFSGEGLAELGRRYFEAFQAPCAATRNRPSARNGADRF